VEQICRIGLDTSKRFFQLHGVNAAEKVVLRKKLRRQEMVAFFEKLAPTVIGIEACGASHHWARLLRSIGHEVKLIAAQLVKRYVKRGKNDTADAEALCEAMSRPTMRFVPMKTAEQQAALMLVGLRDRLIRNRAQLSNAIRGYAADAQHGSVDQLGLGVSVIGTALFLVVSLTIGQRIVSALIRWSNDNFVSELPVITTILVLMGAMALATHAIGVHTVLGAFVAGILVGRSPILTEHIRDNLRGLIVALFMPVFFGVAGLTADLTVLRNPSLLLFAGGLILIASLGKFGGAFLGGSLSGLSHRDAFVLGCGMNARGSTEVIVATIGLSMGALNQTLYTMIVAMAFVTTMAMPPTLRWALARLPITPEEHDRLAREAFEAKGFVANLERLLLRVDRSANGQFASRLAGLLSAWRRMPITVLELGTDDPVREQAPGVVRSSETVIKKAAETAGAQDGEEVQGGADVTMRRRDGAAEQAVALEARKGYGLLLIGVGKTTAPEGGFHREMARLAASFDGPLVVVEARAAHLEDPSTANLNILVPVSGTDASRRALEVALTIARSGAAPVTLLYVSGKPKRDARRHGLSGRLRYTENAVLSEAVRLADEYQIAAQTVVRRDLPIEDAIAEQVKRGGHDLVVLGVRPRPGQRLFFGDVAADLLERSTSSVMFVAS
jgi:nucleotide-binding universal stress UspA family protein